MGYLDACTITQLFHTCTKNSSTIQCKTNDGKSWCRVCV